VTSATQTLIDLSCLIDPLDLELALEDALRRRLTSIPTLWMALGRERGSVRRPARTLRSLILDHGPGGSSTDSSLEVRVLQAIDGAGLPRPLCQYDVSGPNGFRTRLDFAYPGALVAIEADGFRWHSGRSAFERDRRRLSILASLGWRIIFVTWDELVTNPDRFLSALKLVIGQRALF
jgi:restriction endonuclease-like protein